MSALYRLRERLAQALAQLAARVDAVLDGLSPRDRKAVLGLYLFALVGLCGLLAWLSLGQLRSMDSRAKALTSDLAYVQAQRAEYEVSAAALARAEEQLRQTQDLNFSALVEKAAAEAGMKDSVQGIKELSATSLGALEQKNHSVDINRITQDQLVSFLYALEAGGHPLKVMNTNIKVVLVSGEKRLNVRLEVATFRLGAGAVAEEAEG